MLNSSFAGIKAVLNKIDLSLQVMCLAGQIGWLLDLCAILIQKKKASLRTPSRWPVAIHLHLMDCLLLYSKLREKSRLLMLYLLGKEANVLSESSHITTGRFSLEVLRGAERHTAQIERLAHEAMVEAMLGCNLTEDDAVEIIQILVT